MKGAPSYDELEANIRTEAARRGSEIVAKRREDKQALEGNLADAAETQATQLIWLEPIATMPDALKDHVHPTRTRMKSVAIAIDVVQDGEVLPEKEA
ncbi:unnamed protein product [Aphanomyces euteiches]